MAESMELPQGSAEHDQWYALRIAFTRAAQLAGFSGDRATTLGYAAVAKIRWRIYYPEALETDLIQTRRFIARGGHVGGSVAASEIAE